MKQLLLLFMMMSFGISLWSEVPDRMRIMVETVNGASKLRLLNGKKIFTNRTYTLKGVPSDFMGFEFLSTEGGVQESLRLTPSYSGSIYLMATSGSLIDGWTELSSPGFCYTDGTQTALSIYNKEVEGGVQLELPVVSSFAGATLLARSIVVDGQATVEVAGHLVDIDTIVPGTFGSGFPSILTGLPCAKAMQQGEPIDSFRCDRATTVYLLAHSKTTVPEQWRKLPGSFLSNSKVFYTYQLDCTPQDGWMHLPSSKEVNSHLAVRSIERVGFEAPPGVVIAQGLAPKSIFLANPTLAVLPDGSYVASCTGAFRVAGDAANASLFRSTDKGRSWQVLHANNFTLSFSKLFVHKDTLYHFGTKGSYKDVIIRSSVDGGATWTTPTSATNGVILTNGYYHSASVPVIEHSGRLWRGMERADNGSGLAKKTMMLSCPSDADILNAANWTVSNALSYDKSWISENGGTFGDWLEGNAVPLRNGGVALIMRVDDNVNGDKAAFISVSPDGKTLSFDPKKDILRFPGGSKKFVIRYDARSDKYLTISNEVFAEDMGKGTHCGLLRNRVTLSYSEDLRTWHRLKTLISNDDFLYHGYQYIDWDFEGSDIIAVSRTAHDSELGLPVRQHDANYFTFHRFEDVRQLIPLSVEQHSDDTSSVDLFPNPTDDYLQIVVEHDNCTFRLYDLKGTLQHERVLTVRKSGFSLRDIYMIDGIYVAVVSLPDGKQLARKKVILTAR